MIRQKYVKVRTKGMIKVIANGDLYQVWEILKERISEAFILFITKSTLKTQVTDNQLFLNLSLKGNG
jgi:hypothetical protein